MKSLLVFAMAAMFLIPLGRTAMAAPEAIPAPTKTSRMHFKGTMQSSEIYSNAFHTMFVSANGSGEANVLERFTASYQMEANLVDMSLSESISFAGANGDSLQATAVGQAIEDRTPGMFNIVEIYTITDGTGRFAGATGTFTLKRLVSITVGLASSTFEGYLIIPSR